jgi:hypothetical protein
MRFSVERRWSKIFKLRLYRHTHTAQTADCYHFAHSWYRSINGGQAHIHQFIREGSSSWTQLIGRPSESIWPRDPNRLSTLNWLVKMFYRRERRIFLNMYNYYPCSTKMHPWCSTTCRRLKDGNRRHTAMLKFRTPNWISVNIIPTYTAFYETNSKTKHVKNRVSFDPFH